MFSKILKSVLDYSSGYDKSSLLSVFLFFVCVCACVCICVLEKGEGIFAYLYACVYVYGVGDGGALEGKIAWEPQCTGPNMAKLFQNARKCAPDQV